MRNLASEFGESTNSIRIELNRLEAGGLLKSESIGNKKMFQANEEHPLFNDLHNITMKWVGIDKIIEYWLSKIGNLQKAYITGDLATGKDSKIIDIILVGESLNNNFIVEFAGKAEKLIKRKIRYIVVKENEVKGILDELPGLLIWKCD